MPRSARLHETGDFHHVMSHGIDSLNLFESDEDCLTFLSIVERTLTKFDCRCYGFVLMSNHYHLILRPSGENFSKIMRRINTAYARYINRTRHRRGYVFWDRFKSIPTRNQHYLAQLLLYIHTNPLRAGMVNSISELDSYKWSSHACYRGNTFLSWITTSYLSNVFSSINTDKSYESFLAEYTGASFNPWDIDEECDRVNVSIPHTIDENEAQWIRQKIIETEERKRVQKKLQKKPDVLNILLDKACEAFNVTLDDLRSKRRTVPVSRAVQIFSYWAVQCAGFSGAFIGRLLGRNGASILRFANKENLYPDIVPICI
jgi:REP element-mobilizing transposase RayT